MTPNQCRAARALIDLTQTELASIAGCGLSTVVDFEKSRRAVPAETIAKLVDALERAGIIFIPEDDAGRGVRLARPS